MRIMVGVLMVAASTAHADEYTKPTPFDQGHFTVSVMAGSQSSFNQRYIAVGAGGGYFVVNGLEVEAAAEHWFGDGPSVSMVSPGIRYVVQPLVPVSPVVPYVGGFYRHWFVSGAGLEDVDTVGARAGIEYINGRVIVGLGAGFEHTISTCTQDCNQVYPEFSLGFTF